MKTISINVKATNVEVKPCNNFVNLIADIVESETDILAEIDEDTLVDYVRNLGYTCEIK